MSESRLRELAREEYKNGLRQEITESGLKETVKKRCDNIAALTHGLLYQNTWAYITEQLNEILDIVEIKGAKE